MMRFELYNFHEGAVNLTVTKTAISGKSIMNAFYMFESGKIYRTHDPIIYKWVKGEIPGAEIKSLASSELRETLEFHNIPYKKIQCSSCAGSKPHYLYNPFHIIEEAND